MLWRSAKLIGLVAKCFLACHPSFGALRNQRGVTLIEYGLVVALFSAVMAAALNTLGPTIKGVLTTAASAMN
jgi:Flp pilus assembly pilin Flp